MDENVEIEILLSEIDFSQGKEYRVWEKIKLKIKNHTNPTSPIKDDNGFDDLYCNIESLKYTHKNK